MEFEGFLLNTDSITPGSGAAAVRLWLKKSDGTTVAAIDRNFQPYFYMRNPPSEIQGAEGFARSEKTTRKLFGKEIELSRITVRHPGYVPKLRTMGESFEADVPFDIRYVIDKRLTPMGWAKISGKEIEIDEKKYFDIESIEPIAREEFAPLKIMAFDIESYQKNGTDFMVIMGVGTNFGTVAQFSADPKDRGKTADKSVVEQFVRFVKDEDPDIIVTYNGDAFDWPYLQERAEESGLRVNVGRDGSAPISHKGAIPRISVTGRANIDLYRVVERDLGEIKVKTLKLVSEALGVLRTDERVMIPHEQLSNYWENEEKRKLLLQYNKDDVVSTIGVAEKLLPLQYELAKMVKQPLDEVTKMGRGRQVDWFLINEAARTGEISPNKHEYSGDEGAVEGGFVLQPKPGLHENVSSLDFGAMYPSIMIGYNISPDTLIYGQKEKPAPEDYNEAPEVGHKFRKQPDGFFKRILQELITKRFEMKRKLKTMKAGPERELLDIRQKTIKILTNSFYGYMGWLGARWYRKECAEATTAWGRHLIKEVMSRAKAQGIEVYYGDTDSVFCSYSDKIPGFVKSINDEFPVDLELQDIFQVIFFTGAKKRYAGLTSKGELVIKGLEVRRGDWCQLAKDTQQNVIDILLRQRDPAAALNYVKDIVNRLRNGNYSIEELTIHKKMTRSASSYETKQAHVSAVMRAIEQGVEIEEGGKIAYVVLTGKGILSEKSKLVGALKPGDKLDVDYYIDKQVVSAALRILEYFGYSEEDLKGKPKQSGLDRWF